MCEFALFESAYNAYNDNEFRDNYFYWQRRAAYTSLSLFESLKQERPLALILANKTKYWYDAVQNYTKVNKKYDKLWRKMQFEAYKICQEIGIDEFNSCARKQGFDFLIRPLDEEDTIEGNIEYYREETGE